jgi:predicted nucleotidyltransferase
MPVRSSSSRVLRWPDENEVRLAAARFAQREGARPGLIRLGYFGSYANGTWGVGSDLDLVAVVRESAEPFERRALSWDLAPLPVPAEILVYTSAEWDRMARAGERFARTLAAEAIWLIDRTRPATDDGP